MISPAGAAFSATAAPNALEASTLPDLYLDLLKRALLNELGLENELRITYLQSCIDAATRPDPDLLHDIRFALADRFEALMSGFSGASWPLGPFAPYAAFSFEDFGRRHASFDIRPAEALEAVLSEEHRLA